MMKAFVAIKNYLLDSKAELKKVSWLNKQEIIRLTTIVLIVSVMVAGFISVLDFLFTGLLNILI